MTYAHFRLLLFPSQHCCHLFVGTITNHIQENLRSREYYQEDGINYGKKKVKAVPLQV
jgi:hypothetical protein